MNQQHNNGFDPSDMHNFFQQLFGQATSNQQFAQQLNQAGLNPQMLFEVLRQAKSGQAADPLQRVREVALKTVTETTRKQQVANLFQVEKTITNSLTLATAWLDRACAISQPGQEPKFLDPQAWINASVENWLSLALPMSKAVTGALTELSSQQLPQEVGGMLDSFAQVITNINAGLFQIQLGRAIGMLALNVHGAGDSGVPVLPVANHAGGAFVSRNIANFVVDLESNAPEMVLYLTTRELASARLFNRAKWLQAHLAQAINDYAMGISINITEIEHLTDEFDPHDADSFQELLDSGALLPKPTELQLKASARIEHLLALIAGWVDTVTQDALRDLPQLPALSELLRRRTATNEPAEKMFAMLVGTQLKPRKLREAAALWQQITEQLGQTERDELWRHPDLLPTVTELADPKLFFERISKSSAADADFDAELAALLEQQQGDGDTENN